MAFYQLSGKASWRVMRSVPTPSCCGLSAEECSIYYNPSPAGGADSILLVAGTDATDEFNAIHSAKAKAMLLDYYIGDLEGATPAGPAPAAANGAAANGAAPAANGAVANGAATNGAANDAAANGHAANGAAATNGVANGAAVNGTAAAVNGVANGAAAAVNGAAAANGAAAELVALNPKKKIAFRLAEKEVRLLRCLLCHLLRMLSGQSGCMHAFAALIYLRRCAEASWDLQQPNPARRHRPPRSPRRRSCPTTRGASALRCSRRSTASGCLWASTSSSTPSEHTLAPFPASLLPFPACASPYHCLPQETLVSCAQLLSDPDAGSALPCLAAGSTASW